MKKLTWMLLTITILMGVTACGGEKMEDLPLATQEDFEKEEQDNLEEDATVVVVPDDTTDAVIDEVTDDVAEDVTTSDIEDTKEEASSVIVEEEKDPYWETHPIKFVKEYQFDELDKCSMSYGGIIPVKEEDGLWGLINLNGEVVCEPQYNGLWMYPNYEGYTVFNNDGLFCIVDKNGREVFIADKSTINLYISDNDKITRIYDVQDGVQKVEYLNIDGTLIYETVIDNYVEMYGVGGPKPQTFNEGVAVANKKIIRLDEETMQVSVKDWEVDAYEVSPYANGYCMVLSDNGLCLIDVETGKTTVPFWLRTAVEKHRKIRDVFGYEKVTSAGLEAYFKNGIGLCNYKNYGCMEVHAGEDDVKVLFKFDEVQEGADGVNKLGDIIVYDDIFFDDFDYLAVRSGDKYFYIDYSGNVKSKEYVKATSFSTSGYAAVLDETNTVHILNDNFEVVQSIENVSGIRGYGDVFLIVRDEKYEIYAFEPTNN